MQDDRFDATDSITVCGFTSKEVDAPLLRPLVEPDERNGLREPSRLMVDKLTTLPRAKLRHCIGRLDEDAVLRLNRAMVVLLGLAGPAADS